MNEVGFEVVMNKETLVNSNEKEECAKKEAILKCAPNE